jgi:CheR methyltransferase, SAM binding domain
LPFLAAIASLLLFTIVAGAQRTAAARRITWDDLAPLHGYLQKRGLGPTTFAPFVDRTRTDNERRVREGDLDHLIFYLLQSNEISTPPIEPALSAKALVDGMDEGSRQAFLRGEPAPLSTIPKAADERIARGLLTLEGDVVVPRRDYFRDLVRSVFPSPADRLTGVRREYLRAMRFVYLKEFVAQRAERPGDAVAELYRARGLSTDTAVEAGFVVSEGLGIAAALDPARRMRRVLIVGPGLDIAPRTSFNQTAPPQSYQPWAMMDALVALKLSASDNLTIVGADINPRVVLHLQRDRDNAPKLRLSTEIRDADGVTLRSDFREYFTRLGTAIGSAGIVETRDGRLTKTVQVAAANARALDSEPLDIVTERLQTTPFDLIVATNILPYFDDTQLALALSNIAAMLAPGGLFLHNERRPIVGDLGEALGLSFEQSRHVTIADVRGGAPLFDSVFLHRKKQM